jgi:ribose/xylose/arabinose/galactoside ABC-type transport system permease subunit
MAQIEEKNKPVGSTVRDIARRVLRHENAVLLLVLIGLIGVMSFITNGVSTARANVANMLVQSAVRGTASIGQAFVILTGGIDISIGGVGLFCSLLGSALITSQAGRNIVGEALPAYAGIAIMLLAGLGLGSINGIVVSRVGIPALVMTLGMWEILKGAAFQVSGGMSISQLPESLTYIGKGDIAGVPIVVIIFITVAVAGYFVLNHTTFGKNIYGVGGNPVTAWLSGVNIRNLQTAIYSISGLLGGLAAVLITARIMSTSNQTLAGLEIDSIASVCVGGVSLAGGRGNLIGVVIGVLIIGVANNAMSIMGATPDTEGIVKGTILIVAVVIDHIRRRS